MEIVFGLQSSSGTTM